MSVKKIATITILFGVLFLSACESVNLEEFTKKVENFTLKNESQNTLVNYSRVTTHGEFSSAELMINAEESHLMTPVQLRSARANLRSEVIYANDRREYETLEKLSKISREFEEEFKTQNDVVTLSIKNTSLDPVDMSGTQVLIVDESGERVNHVVLSHEGLYRLNKDAFFVDRKSNSKVEFTNGSFGVIPALTTHYKAVTIAGISAGKYQLILSGVPGSNNRFIFPFEKS